MNRYTPPPLFNILRNDESSKLRFSPSVLDKHTGIFKISRFTPSGAGVRFSTTFTPVSSNVRASPIETKTSPNTIMPVKNDKEEDESQAFSLTWWENNSLFLYDAMLMSAFYGMKWFEFRDFFKIPTKNFLLVADSGGYEQLTSGIRLEPVTVLRWEEKNADIGIALDVPPKDPVTHAPAGDIDFFKRCAEQTRRNTELMIQNRNYDSKLKFYSVLQGGDKEQLDIWYDYIKDFEVDGLCSSPQPAQKPMPTALHLGYVYSKGIKNLHILLGTGNDVTPVNVYASQYFDLFTFDSSSYGQGSKLREYWLPFNLREKISFGEKSETVFKSLPCDCPICQLATVENMRDKGSVPGALISLHNLYNYVRNVKFLESLREDEDYYIAHLRKYYSPDTVKAVEFLRDCREIGFETAHKSYYPKSKLVRRFE